MKSNKTAVAATPETVTVVLSRDKECKGSVRFSTDNVDAPVTNVYISRKVKAVENAASVKLTIEI